MRTSPDTPEFSGSNRITHVEQSRSFSILILWLILVAGCKDDRHPYARFQPEHVEESVDSASVYAVVEIPAGTTMLRKLDTISGEIRPVEKGNIDFLPAPGNVGFIASTLDPRYREPLQTVLLMEALSPGSVVEVAPIGVLQLTGDDRLHEIIVAVPVNPALQSIQVDNFVDFITDYEPARYILQEWFVNYMGFGAFQLVGWQDERHADHRILKYRIE